MEFADPAFREELGYWIGQGVFGTSWLMSKIGKLAVTHINMGASTAKKDSAVLMSSPVLGLISSNDNSRETQIKVGQIYQRLSLVAAFRSNQIGVFTGSAIILVIAYFTIRWVGAKRTGELLMVGGIWLVLTVAFEVLFGRFVIGLTWERISADYNMLNGGLMPLGLLILLLSPMIASELRAKR